MLISPTESSKHILKTLELKILWREFEIFRVCTAHRQYKASGLQKISVTLIQPPPGVPYRDFMNNRREANSMRKTANIQRNYKAYSEVLAEDGGFALFRSPLNNKSSTKKHMNTLLTRQCKYGANLL